MKLKAVFILFLTLHLCYSNNSVLKSIRTSMKKGPCTTLMQYDKQTRKQLVESNGLVVCSGIAEKEVKIASNASKSDTGNNYLFTLRSPTEIQAIKHITYKNDAWMIQIENNYIPYNLKTKGAFYILAYYIFFLKNKLLASTGKGFTKLEMESLLKNLKQTIDTLLNFNGLIEYILQLKDINDWTKIANIINHMSMEKKSFDVGLLFRALGKIDAKDIYILNMAIDSRNDKLLLPTELLLQDPNQFNYLKDYNQDILMCLKGAKRSNNLFVKTFKKFKFSDILLATQFFIRLKNKIKKFKAPAPKSVLKPVPRPVSEAEPAPVLIIEEIYTKRKKKTCFGITEDVIDDFFESQDEVFDIFSLKKNIKNEQKEIIKKILNFEGRRNKNLENSDIFSVTNLRTLQKFLTYFKSLKNCLGIRVETIKYNSRKNKGPGEANPPKHKVSSDDIYFLRKMGRVELEKLLFLVKTRLSIQNITDAKRNNRPTENVTILNSKTKELIVSLFNGIPKFEIIPFLKRIHIKLKKLKQFKTINSSSDSTTILNKLNELTAFVKPFIIHLDRDFEEYIRIFNDEIYQLGLAFGSKSYELNALVKDMVLDQRLLTSENLNEIESLLVEVQNITLKMKALLANKEIKKLIDNNLSCKLNHLQVVKLGELIEAFREVLKKGKKFNNRLSLILGDELRESWAINGVFDRNSKKLEKLAGEFLGNTAELNMKVRKIKQNSSVFE
jgi:hypothetical protein